MTTRTNRVARGSLAVLAAVVVVGCLTGECNASPREDPWFQAPPAGATVWKWTTIKNTEMAETTRQMWPQAKQMLQKVSIVELSLLQVQALTGKRLLAPEGKTPYLVRALYFQKATGGFSVCYLGNKLLVDHGSLGNHDVPMKRSALVVFLKTRPKHVYVTCSMAE